MPVLRNRFSITRAGGPRQFAELRDKLLIKVESNEIRGDVEEQLRLVGLDVSGIRNAPILTAEPEQKIEDVLDRIRQQGEDSTKIRQGITEIKNAREKGEEIIETTSSIIAATREFQRQIGLIEGVTAVQFVQTLADFGPENLRVSPLEMTTLDPDTAQDEPETLGEIIELLDIPEAWEVTRGENAIVAIFDTGFSEDLIDSSRIIGTFHGGDTDSAFESSEGHGTMTAGAAAANSDEGLPFDGIAPDAGVILVRITDSEGQIRSDVISSAWDWLINLDVDRPIVTNHSYGTPLCSGRPKAKFCTGPDIDVIKIANSKSSITSCYAAGNEAMTCGHRPSGLTNGITGANSIEDVITVGALRLDGREAQRYSSHGRGDCAPISDPKPNVSCAIPMKTYYGGEDGWEIKDMSIGVGGSAGGTSHASPLITGMLALVQSAAFSKGEALQTERIKQLLRDHSTPPHVSQVNKFGVVLSESGYDARFGFGQFNVASAINEVIQ